jgi:hypothetical protein
MNRVVKTAAAFLLGFTLVVVATSPAQAINVRYRAAQSCFVDGREFRAEIKTYGKPTTAGQYTEVQQWGYVLHPDGGDTANSTVEATRVKWVDGSWKHIDGIGYAYGAREDGYWHAGQFQSNQEPFIGYTADFPIAVMVRVYFDGNIFKTCQVTLRPYDLYWIG